MQLDGWTESASTWLAGEYDGVWRRSGTSLGHLGFFVLWVFGVTTGMNRFPTSADNEWNSKAFHQMIEAGSSMRDGQRLVSSDTSCPVVDMHNTTSPFLVMAAFYLLAFTSVMLRRFRAIASLYTDLVGRNVVGELGNAQCPATAALPPAVLLSAAELPFCWPKTSRS